MQITGLTEGGVVRRGGVVIFLLQVFLDRDSGCEVKDLFIRWVSVLKDKVRFVNEVLVVC